MLSWLPNWKDRTAYPDTKTTRPIQWAWQFLRRNSLYQARWDALMRPYWNFADHSYDDSAIFNDEAGPPISRVIESPSRIMQREFSLWHLPPPPEMSGSILIFDHMIVAMRDRPSSGPSHIAQGEVAVTFKLGLPLDGQLKRAQRVLEDRAAHLSKMGRLKRANTRNHPGQWQTYLRLLDAEAAQADTREIASIIYPAIANVYPDYHANRDVRRDLVVARKLRDHDYRYIAR